MAPNFMINVLYLLKKVGNKSRIDRERNKTMMQITKKVGEMGAPFLWHQLS